MGKQWIHQTFSRQKHIDCKQNFVIDIVNSAESYLVKIGTQYMVCKSLNKLLDPEFFRCAFNDTEFIRLEKTDESGISQNSLVNGCSKELCQPN